MNIYSYETELRMQIQRQLRHADQFRALVREMRSVQRRVRRRIELGEKAKDCKDAIEHRDRLQDAVDRELAMLDSD